MSIFCNRSAHQNGGRILSEIWLFFLKGFTLKMGETGNFQPRRRKNRKKLNLESLVAEAESLLASQKKKRKPYVSFFSKKPVTGVRSTHCKYRPRKGRSTATVSGRCMTFAECRLLTSLHLGLN